MTTTRTGRRCGLALTIRQDGESVVYDVLPGGTASIFYLRKHGGDDNPYVVSRTGCSCLDYQCRRRRAGQKCKHMQALAAWARRLAPMLGKVA